MSDPNLQSSFDRLKIANSKLTPAFGPMRTQALAFARTSVFKTWWRPGFAMAACAIGIGLALWLVSTGPTEREPTLISAQAELDHVTAAIDAHLAAWTKLTLTTMPTDILLTAINP